MPVPHFVIRKTTQRVVQKATLLVRPQAERNRLHAWQHLTTPQAPAGWAGEMANTSGALPPTGTLKEVADKYDDFAKLVELDAADELTETDVLASILVIRALREKLAEDERRLIATARSKKVTWARLAEALELRSRQAAERRYLQLRTDMDELHGSTLTQEERIEYARDQRDRRAERAWAVSNATTIRELAQRLLNVPDLQTRADHSVSAQKMHETAMRSAMHTGTPLPETAVSMPWPKRLREAYDADAALQETPTVRGTSDLNPARLKATRVANAIHQLSGLLANAANPENVDLADQGNLQPAVTALFAHQDRFTLPT
ncbi:hypothetical protein [Streptomyces sp. NBC_00887]|uniref:hypothetical protein n=1 Tax=Streptomyces sp. NBC_00887 TaxID=2975859 RepID=UPI0038694348|nr:hypothetical protein OG844_46740 [Streptomyces sp. NBC_00887]